MTSVLVDTTIWSLALRRHSRQLSGNQRRLGVALADLITRGGACLAGPIRQEILSGIRHPTAFETLQTHLDGFDHVIITTADYDRAAEFHNILSDHGIAGGAIDLLLCAISYRCDFAIFTTDPDFDRYSQHLPIRLHEPDR